MGGRKHGKKGKDVEFRVPVGTEVWQSDGDRTLLADMTVLGERVMLLQGGSGGRGNTRFTTSVNRFPLLAEAGEAGRELDVGLELKLLADVGITGVPNAGKSTLLRALTAARPRVADYPFTTTEPVLGVGEWRGKVFVLVDIPGLLEGAHDGVGLGDDFLRHVERTRVVVHVLDGSGGDPVADYRKIRKEMLLFNKEFERKPEIVALNKLDLDGVARRAGEVRDKLEGAVAAFCCISAAGGTGLELLQDEILRTLAALPGAGIHPELVEKESAVPVLRPQARESAQMVRKVGDDFVVVEGSATRVAGMVDEGNWEARLQLYDYLRRLGVIAALEKAGIRSGQVFKMGKIEWEWE